MKKLVFAFILAFAATTLMAQQIAEHTEVLDSLVITDTDYDFVRAKFNYSYDNQGRLFQVLFSKILPYTSDLQYCEKWHYDYDDNDRCFSLSYWKWENDAWFLYQKIDSTFNASGDCVFVSEFNSSEHGIGHSYHLTEYVFENNKCIERSAYEYTDPDTLWAPISRSTWEYDNWGNRLQEIYYFSDGNEWIFSSKTIYTYDDQLRLILEDYFLWDANTGAWVSRGATEYEYNTGGSLLRMHYLLNNLEKEAKYLYDERNNLIWYYFCQTTLPDFIWEQDTTEFAYNEHDSLIYRLENFTHHNANLDHPVLYEYERDEQDRVVVESCFDNLETGQMPRYRNETVYDEQGRIVVKHHLFYSMNNGEVLSNTMVEYEFDGQGNLVAETESSYQYGQGTETYHFNQTFDYNTPSSSILGIGKAWNDFIGFMIDHETNWITDGLYYYWTNYDFPILNKWESGVWRFKDPDTWSVANVEVALYYSKYYESLPETSEFSTRVYNIEGGLVVESDEPADIVVYDMLGRAVAQKLQATHYEFYLKSGLYVVKVNSVAMKAVVM